MAESVKVIDPDMGSGYDYDSLFDWEAAQQADIDTSNTIAVAKCRCTGGTADTTAVTIDGWTTSAADYIKIWTDPAESYRHNGTWSTGNKYRLITSGSGNTFIISVSYCKILGLQIQRTALAADNTYIISATSNVGIEIGFNIIRGNGDTDWYDGGLTITGGNGPLYIYNNILYEMGGGTTPTGMWVNTTTGAGVWMVYNNTIIGQSLSYGVFQYDGVAYAINNIIKSCTVAFSGSFDSASGHNATDLASMGYTGATGTGDRLSQTFTFVGASDFHLASNDAGALGFGLNLYNDANYPFQTDIDGQDRGGAAASWDIGADEYVSAVTNLSIFASECVGSEGVFG